MDYAVAAMAEERVVDGLAMQKPREVMGGGTRRVHHTTLRARSRVLKDITKSSNKDAVVRTKSAGIFHASPHSPFLHLIRMNMSELDVTSTLLPNHPPIIITKP
jgi:hypothetical protein